MLPLDMLSPEHRRAVIDLVEAALKFDPAIGADFIRDASQGDPALRDEALRLLQDIHARRNDTRRALPTDSDLIDEVLSETLGCPDPCRRCRRTTIPRNGAIRSATEARLRRFRYCVRKLRSRSAAIGRGEGPAAGRSRLLVSFKREFRALVDIRHPNLIQLYELFCEDQFWFFTMEFVRGLNFSNTLSASGPGTRLPGRLVMSTSCATLSGNCRRAFSNCTGEGFFTGTSSRQMCWCRLTGVSGCWISASCTKSS